jgi:Uma2 family endonuclease
VSFVPPTAADKEQEVVYPASDGEPLAETPIHVRAIILLFQALEDWFANRPDVYIAANMFWYWEQGKPESRRAPDVMVIKGVGRAERRSFFSWKENNAVPCFILEVTSEKTWREDYFEKRELYARLGVSEYFLFDPDAVVLHPPLQGFRRSGSGTYVQLELDDQGRLYSEELGVYLKVEDQVLRLIDGVSGQPILTREERAAAERLRAEAEKQRAEALAAEVARLRALLEQQKGGQPS